MHFYLFSFSLLNSLFPSQFFGARSAVQPSSETFDVSFSSQLEDYYNMLFFATRRMWKGGWRRWDKPTQYYMYEMIMMLMIPIIIQKLLALISSAIACFDQGWYKWTKNLKIFDFKNFLWQQPLRHCKW